MMEENMEEDYPDKENITPKQQQFNKVQLDNDIHFISPIILVPIGQ
jgi:hypothetical protein